MCLITWTKLYTAIDASKSCLFFFFSPPILKRRPNLLKLILIMRALSRNTQLKPSAQTCSDAHNNLKPYEESKQDKRRIGGRAISSEVRRRRRDSLICGVGES